MTKVELEVIIENLEEVSKKKLLDGLEEYGEMFWKFNDSTQKTFIKNCIGFKK
jgi:hypothetical protein